jgi:hypothetical protein
MTAYERIIDQAQKAISREPVPGLEDLSLGLFGLTHVDLRLGNIIAIARVAERKANEQV